MDDIEEYKKYLLSHGQAPEEVAKYGDYLKLQSGSASAPQLQDVPSVDTEAALQGFGQGGTAGYLPELQARVGHVMTGEPYADLKNAFKQREERLKERSPGTSALGQVAGAMMTLPVGGAAKGANLITRAAKAAGVGAAYGGLSNPNVDSTPEDPYAELKARLANAKFGAVLGGAGEATLGSVAPMIQKFGERTANKAVVKQIGANAGQIKKIIQKDELPKIEKFVRNEGLMRAGKSLEDVADASKQVLDTDGPKIGALYEKAQADASLVSALPGTLGKTAEHQISGVELADQILANAKAKYKSHPNRNMVMKEMEEAVQPLRDMGDNANIVDVHNYRKGLDENINWSQKAQERDAIQNAFIDARNIVADKTKNTIEALDETLGGNQLKELKKLNERYSAASTVNNISTQGAARETAKAFMGHGVIGAGAGLGAGSIEYNRSHDPVKAAMAALAGATLVTGARKFGAPVGYYGGKALQGIGRAGRAITPPPAGMVAPWLLMQRQGQ